MLGVVDAHLARQGTAFLVGDRITYADLMFIPYFKAVGTGELALMAKEVDTTEFAAYTAWFARVLERPAVKRIADRYDGLWEQIVAAQAAGGH